MTLQITKNTTKGAPAQFWQICEVVYSSHVTQVDLKGFFNEDSLLANEHIDIVRGFSVDAWSDPLKNPANTPIFLEYLEANPTKTLFDASMSLLEKYLIDNIPGWEEAIII